MYNEDSEHHPHLYLPDQRPHNVGYEEQPTGTTYTGARGGNNAMQGSDEMHGPHRIASGVRAHQRITGLYDPNPTEYPPTGGRNRTAHLGLGPPPRAGPGPNLARSGSFNPSDYSTSHPSNTILRPNHFQPIHEAYSTALDIDTRPQQNQYPFPQPHRPSHDQRYHDEQLNTMFQTLRLQQEHTQMLAAENAELKAQLTQTGAGHKITTSTVTSRGRLASRGKVTVRSGRNPAVIHRERSTSVLADDGGNSSEPESDHHPADEDPTAAVVYLDRKNCDTVEVKKARTALQVFVSKTFREVCGVSTKDRWPDFDEFRVDEVTRLRLPNPKFAADVKDLANVRLFLTVAKQAQADLRRRGNRPKDLLAVKARWDLELLQEMAKTSFQNFKPAWKKQFDLAAQARDEAKKRTNRWRQRRITKVEQNAKGIPKFAAEYNMDPATLLEINYEDHQSDEASGPDSDDDRYDSKMAWKVEMARLAGYSNLTAQELEKLNMLEVINPDWRSDTLSTVFHDLHGRWRNSRTAKEKESVIYTRVRTSGRRSRRIPAVSPWDFGISSQWLEAARADETNDDRLREWGTFGNPVGWDSTLFDAATTTATTPIIPSAGSRASEDDPPAPNAQAVDPRFDFDSLYD